MEYTSSNANCREALDLLNATLEEFRNGKMEKFDAGALSENIEILFSEDINDQFIVDIYLRSDECHENQLAGFVCDDYRDVEELQWLLAC